MIHNMICEELEHVLDEVSKYNTKTLLGDVSTKSGTEDTTF